MSCAALTKQFTFSSSSISEIFRSIARFSRFSFSDNELFVAWNKVRWEIRDYLPGIQVLINIVKYSAPHINDGPGILLFVNSLSGSAPQIDSEVPSSQSVSIKAFEWEHRVRWSRPHWLFSLSVWALNLQSLRSSKNVNLLSSCTRYTKFPERKSISICASRRPSMSHMWRLKWDSLGSTR